MFGDNEAVVNGASLPHSKLGKRHNALAYHRTRTCIAAGMVQYNHMDGDKNPADILSKHWAMHKVWDTLKPLMFGRGDANEATVDDKSPDAKTASIVEEKNEVLSPPATG